jgi:hypothetical protein
LDAGLVQVGAFYVAKPVPNYQYDKNICQFVILSDLLFAVCRKFIIFAAL